MENNDDHSATVHSPTEIESSEENNTKEEEGERKLGEEILKQEAGKSASAPASDYDNSDEDEVTAAPLQGWLQKQGAKRKSWRIRWFEQKGGRLIYSKAKAGPEKGAIDLEQITCVKEETPMLQRSFTIRSPKSPKSVPHESHESASNKNESVDISSSISSINSRRNERGTLLGGSKSNASNGGGKVKFPVGFIIETPKRTYYLTAQTEQEKHYWVKGLNNVINQRNGNGHVAKLKKKKNEVLLLKQQLKEAELSKAKLELRMKREWEEKDKKLRSMIEMLRTRLEENEEMLSYQKLQLEELERQNKLTQQIAEKKEQEKSDLEKQLRRTVKVEQGKVQRLAAMFNQQSSYEEDTLEQGKKARKLAPRPRKKGSPRVSFQGDRIEKNEDEPTIMVEDQLNLKRDLREEEIGSARKEEDQESKKLTIETDLHDTTSDQEIKYSPQIDASTLSSEVVDSTETDSITFDDDSENESENDSEENIRPIKPLAPFSRSEWKQSHTQDPSKRVLPRVPPNSHKKCHSDGTYSAFSKSLPSALRRSEIPSLAEHEAGTDERTHLLSTDNPLTNSMQKRWTKANTCELKRSTSTVFNSFSYTSSQLDKDLKSWERPDMKKRMVLLKGKRGTKKIRDGATEAGIRSSGNTALHSIPEESVYVTLKITCPDVPSKSSKAVKVEYTSTVESLLKKKHVAEFIKRLKTKNTGETVLYYGLYMPIPNYEEDHILKNADRELGNNSDQEDCCKGLWLEEKSPLWRYDIFDHANLEVRCTELVKYTSDKNYNFCLQILYAVETAESDSTSSANSDAGGCARRIHRLFKFNKYSTVSEVMETVNEKFGITQDLALYGIYLHKISGGIWLSPDNILAAYNLGDMDILEVKRRFAELDLVSEEREEARGLMRAAGRLLLDPSSLTTLQAKHTICNWLGIERGKWDSYGLSMDSGSLRGHNSRVSEILQSTFVWLIEDQPLSIYPLTTDVKLELKPKSKPKPGTDEKDLQQEVTESNSENTQARTYKLTVKSQLVASNALHSVTNSEGTEGTESNYAIPAKIDSDVLRHICVEGEVIRQYHTEISYVPINGNVITGTLACTNYAVVFTSKAFGQEGIRVALGSIIRILKASKDLLLHCKDFRPPIRFRINNKSLRKQWYNTLVRSAFPGSIMAMFAFQYRFGGPNDGWNVYNPLLEMQRQFNLAGNSSKRWRISEANKGYKLAATYPEYIGVPASISDDTLRPVFEFRSKGRIPALSYMYCNGATITRSSQPMVGVRGNSCAEDEMLLEAILRANPNDKGNPLLRIFDARPKVNAMANQAMGAGVERCDGNSGYSGCKLEFLNIGNIHVMRDSHTKLYQLCANSNDLSGSYNSLASTKEGAATASSSFLSNLEKTKWLDHTNLILTAATNVALCVYNRGSVLIHCSDGWDRTPQVSALAQILLDKYYRTIKGFQVLIEKEFISFGHKFDERYGHAQMDVTDSQRSPIFPQFVDAVYQLHHQFPSAFEFNEGLLVFLLEHLYSCQFGTFLCNSQKERDEVGLKDKTVSLWSYVNNSTKDNFHNPFYLDTIDVFFPDLGVENLVLWRGYYYRHIKNAAAGHLPEECRLSSLFAKNVTKEIRAMQLLQIIESLKLTASVAVGPTSSAEVKQDQQQQ